MSRTRTKKTTATLVWLILLLVVGTGLLYWYTIPQVLASLLVLGMVIATIIVVVLVSFKRTTRIELQAWHELIQQIKMEKSNLYQTNPYAASGPVWAQKRWNKTEETYAYALDLCNREIQDAYGYCSAETLRRERRRIVQPIINALALFEQTASYISSVHTDAPTAYSDCVIAFDRAAGIHKQLSAAGFNIPLYRLDIYANFVDSYRDDPEMYLEILEHCPPMTVRLDEISAEMEAIRDNYGIVNMELGLIPSRVEAIRSGFTKLVRERTELTKLCGDEYRRYDRHSLQKTINLILADAQRILDMNSHKQAHYQQAYEAFIELNEKVERLERWYMHSDRLSSDPLLVEILAQQKTDKIAIARLLQKAQTEIQQIMLRMKSSGKLFAENDAVWSEYAHTWKGYKQQLLTGQNNWTHLLAKVSEFYDQVHTLKTNVVTNTK